MQRWSKWLTMIFGIVSLLCISINCIETDSGEQSKRASKALNQYLSQSSTSIERFINGDHDKVILANLDQLPLNIEIYHKDTIIYWNRAVSVSIPNTHNDITIKTIGDSVLYAKILLNIHAYNTLKSDSEIVLTSDKTDQTISFEGHAVGFYLKHAKKYPFMWIPGWLSLLFLLTMASIYQTPRIKQSLIGNSGSLVPVVSLLVITGGVFTLLTSTFFTSLAISSSDIGQTYKPGLLISQLSSFIILLILATVFVYLLPDIIQKYKKYFDNKYHLVALITGSFTVLSFALLTKTIERFVLNPNVNLEIESLLTFNGISFTLITGFILSMILIFQSTQILYEWLNKSNLNLNQKLLFSFIGWCTGILISLFVFPLQVSVWKFIIFVISYSLILDAYTDNKDKKITYLLWWMIMFSGFLAIVLFYFGLKKDIFERSSFVNLYFNKVDDTIVEKMLEIQDTLLSKDVFNSIASLDNNAKIDKKDLYAFMFNKPEYRLSDSISLDIELYDKNSGITVFSNYFSDFYKTNQSYTNAYRVNRQVYHNPFENQYITRFEIIRPFPVNASWYLFVIAKNPYTSRATSHQVQNISYAVFSKDRLIEKADNFQQYPDLNILSTANKDTIQNGYSLVVSKPTEQYKIVSWKKISGLIKPISLFSFIFTWTGIILFILTIFNTRFGFLPSNLNLKFGTRSSLKTKIQLAIIILIVVTFLIIGSITALYFKNLIEVNQVTKNKEETVTIVHNIRLSIQNLADDAYASAYLSSKLNEISYIHDKNLSLYDRFGRLIATTSQDDIFGRIPYHFWENQNKKDINDHSAYDTASGHEFIPLYLNNSSAFAFLDIEYHSHDHSADNILDFLSTILNAYIFLFLIAGAIAITIANSITQPLTELAEKLKKFKLGKTNELLEWKSNDEIGILIDEYNNLTQELEDSVDLLARTERDIAWREMAKQVAHEIKNPLTPMKLNIQYLERVTKDNPERTHEMVQRISSSLIEQIDNLSQIAGEFSNFATLPQASNEKISLNEIVETIHDLFRKRDDMDINMIEPIDDLFVFADKNHLVRVLNNLLKNAIQAIPDDRRGKIDIELKRQDNDALIRISDNGTGIPEHMKDKVFTPNFTTKSSGTGLGLAIAANMLDSFNGRIYFETQVGKGTDFFVTIPLMRLDGYITDGQRISLD